jgi:hypothetical protein
VIAMPLSVTEALGLHVGAVADGHVRHALRYDDGSWSPFGDVDPAVDSGDPYVDVSCAWSVRGIAGPGGFDEPAMQLVAVRAHGGIRHAIRSPDGTWSPLGDVFGPVGQLEGVRRISCESTRAGSDPWDDLQVCALTAAGRIWHTIRHRDGTWQPFWGDVANVAGDPGEIVDVACAPFDPVSNWPDSLVVFAATANGGIHATTRRGDGSWTPFAEIPAKTDGPVVGAISRLSARFAPQEQRQLHLCAVSSAGRLWHAIGTDPAGPASWTPFGDVEGPAGERGTFVDVGISALSSSNHENHAGNWVHVLGTTDDGRLWHTIRSWDGSWTPFGDVAAVTGAPAAFRSVAAVVGA